MEDNHLIDRVLAGRGERARNLAEDSHELFFRNRPHDTDREYFQHVFHEVGKIPAAKDLFAEGKTPLWAVAPSGDAAMKLLAFWREMAPETGQLKAVIRGQGRRHPVPRRFVSRPVGARPQEIRPTANAGLRRGVHPRPDAQSGHRRIRPRQSANDRPHLWLRPLPFGWVRSAFRLVDQLGENNEIVAAAKALDGVWGVDINPFAVAIARFRLIVAAFTSLRESRGSKQAPSAWKIHLATGDSLLFGSRWTRTGDKVREQGVARFQ